MVVEIEGVTTPHPLLTPIIEGGLGGAKSSWISGQGIGQYALYNVLVQLYILEKKLNHNQVLKCTSIYLFWVCIKSNPFSQMFFN